MAEEEQHWWLLLVALLVALLGGSPVVGSPESQLPSHTRPKLLFISSYFPGKSFYRTQKRLEAMNKRGVLVNLLCSSLKFGLNLLKICK